MLHFPPWKLVLVIGSVIIGILVSLPNLFSAETLAKFPDWLPKRQISLGLDLQGGAHLLYQLDERQLVQDWLTDTRGEVRDALRRERVNYADLRQSLPTRSVSVQIRDPADFDKAFKAVQGISSPLSSSAFTGSPGKTLDVVRGDNNSITLTITEPGLIQRISHAIESSIETVRRRVDAFGTTEPLIQRQGRDRIVVQVPGISDVTRLKGLVGETGKLEFKLVDNAANVQEVAQSKRPPAGSDLLYSSDTPPQPFVIKQQVMVSGESLMDAQPGFDQRTNEPIVSFRFDGAGAKRFGRVTQENVGLPFAIVLDGKVISAPVIREPILGGSGQISGNFSVQEANDLAILLRSGALPAKLTAIEERTVGPSLGHDSVAAGTLAGIIGAILTLGLTMFAYGLFGFFAAVALIINGILIVAVISAMQATLTLPGIAGIVLTIGMAVDSNVLIFERIREELRAGRPPMSAIEAGFDRAIITIADSQLTTLAAAIIMFWLGSGPVRGFAVTLSIGIATSVFTAVTVTRLMIGLWARYASRGRRLAAVPV